MLMVAACGGTTPGPACPVPEQGGIRFVGSDRQNPDEAGEPLPTIVRLYQLSSIGALETATFEEVWRTADEVLADTVLGVEEVVLYPEQTVYRPFERNDEAQFLAAVAIVRTPIGESWRTIRELPIPASVQTCGQTEDDDTPPPPSTPNVEVLLEDSRVRLSVSMEPPCDGENCDER